MAIQERVQPTSRGRRLAESVGTRVFYAGPAAQIAISYATVRWTVRWPCQAPYAERRYCTSPMALGTGQCYRLHIQIAANLFANLNE